MAYTKNRLTLNAWYNYYHGSAKVDFWSEEYFKMNGLRNTVVSNPDGSKNTKDDTRSGNAAVSADYMISKDRSVSLVYSVDFRKWNNDKDQTILRSYDTGTNLTLGRETRSHERASEHSIGLFYRDDSRRVKYAADVNYRFVPSKYHYQTDETTGFHLDNHFRDRMDYLRFRLNGWTRMADENRLYLGAGYVGTWKAYSRNDYDTRRELNSNSFVRNQLWGTVSYAFRSNTQITANVWTEHIRLENNGLTDHQMPVGGNLMIFQKLKGSNWIRFNYDCSVQYPDQGLSSEYGYFTDSLTWTGGNPWLKSNISHSLRLWFDGWNCFNIQAGCNFSPDRFCSIGEIREGTLPSGQRGKYAHYTYQNTDYRDWWVSTSVTKRFLQNFLYKADLKYTWAKASYQNFSNRGHGLFASTSLNYFWPRAKLNFNAQYIYTRVLNIYPQVRSVSNYEYTCIDVAKSFFKNRLDLQLSYAMFFRFFDDKCITTEDSPAVYRQSLDRAFGRQKNRLVVTLRFRFAGGKSVRQYNRELSDEK